MSLADIDYNKIREIFDRVTEYHEIPVPIGGRCESHYYYRVEDLSEDDLKVCASYVLYRLEKNIALDDINLLLKLGGGVTLFGEILYALWCEHVGSDDLKLEIYSEYLFENGKLGFLRGANSVLVTDVITTARSTLEAHSKATMKGIKIVAWVSLVDRTFGPGPVPVISAFTGAPVNLVTRIG
ncbi:MAG: phosphoribosyltransferase [Deltaproteobacteria bacterium]|nr:phosphoribosyltransferase [Deltaproteobacteria bacterium]MCX7952448.1 phosphoribosyltransferase [Deltaproteobacteria bacterium]